METEPHYFRVGIYIVASVAALAIFALWLASDGVGSSRDYRIYFAESVSGLSVGSPVKYRGVNVGLVDAIGISANDSRYIKVDVKINQTAPVKVGTVASLKLQGITGAIYVELSASPQSAQDLADAQPDRKRPVIPSEESSIAAIMTQMPQIMEKLSTFADQLAKISTDENIERFNEAIDNLAGLTGEARSVLEGTKGNVIDATEQMSGTMSNLRRASRDISNVTERVGDDPSTLIFPTEERGVPAP